MKASGLGNLPVSRLFSIIFQLAADYNDCRFIFTVLVSTWCHIYINTSETRSSKKETLHRFVNSSYLHWYL